MVALSFPVNQKYQTPHVAGPPAVFVHGRKWDYMLAANGKVHRIEKDKMVDLCIHLKDQEKYPKTDNVIALKLLVETNEQEFNKIANDHGNQPRPEVLPEAACG